MSRKQIEVSHCGVTVKISTTRSKKQNGHVYTSYQLADYSSGARKRLTFSDLEEAKKKARDLAEAIGTGKRHTLDWDAERHAQVRRALELASIIDRPLDHIVEMFTDAAKVLGGDHKLVLAAAYYFKEHAPRRMLKAMLVKDVVSAFLADRAPSIGPRRRRTNASYLAQFEKVFGKRNLHEVEPMEIQDWTREKKYSPKTRNDMLNLIGQVYNWAMVRHYATHNPASAEVLKRDRLKSRDIGILTPAQARKLLSAVDEGLKPFLALWLFSGMRKEETSRVTWEQIEQGLASGSVYLLTSQTKTGEARSVPLADNLKRWLIRYRRPSGPVLPSNWQGRDERHQFQRLDDLTGHFKRKLGQWITNGPRHSFATYHLALHKDPGETVRQMGTSLEKLQQHYWARAKAVTSEQALQWFSIAPEEVDNIIPLPDQKPLRPESNTGTLV